jgi:NAD(P)-dependent dehydrogenase (short-subunit alcohol dehydrogenase family)
MSTNLFSLAGKTAAITGGAGLLGYQHAAAIASCGGVSILLDIQEEGLEANLNSLRNEFGDLFYGFRMDVTRQEDVHNMSEHIKNAVGRVDILINNAARNPKVESVGGLDFSRLENFPMEQWNLDLAVGLGGAFICSQVFGQQMALDGKGGVIINIASDLSVIAPDQRLYRKANTPDQGQPVKPVTYSVVKHGMIGLTKYLATYWCEHNIRCNALSPGGVYNGQDDVFVANLVKLIPMGRMAQPDEYRGAIAFLCSDASRYLNGTNLVMDGGRSVW